MAALFQGLLRASVIARCVTLLFAVVVLSGIVYAQDGGTAVTILPRLARPSVAPRSSIRIDVNLVLVPVMVTDPYQRPIAGLHQQDFRVSEDGVQQTISQFFSEEAPLSIGIVFDASNSMHHKIDASREAIREFLRLSIPGDEFFLLKFSDRPESVRGFTSDLDELGGALESIQPAGWTSLYDAIYSGLHQMKRARFGRKALLVLSDGGDNNSRYTENEIKELVKEEDARVFAISIFDKSPSLAAIAEESGGRAFRVRSLDELPDLINKLSAEIHSQYVLGYSPTNRDRDGKYRHVNVQLLPPQGIARPSLSWKHGYYSPVQ